MFADERVEISAYGVKVVQGTSRRVAVVLRLRAALSRSGEYMVMTTGRKPGFTLVELIIVVAILCMMLTVATPLFFQTIAQRRLTAAVERIANDLRYVQSLAVTQGNVHRLHSGADGAVGLPGQYRLERSNDGGVTWAPLGGWYNLTQDYFGSSLQSIKDNAGTTLPSYDVRYTSQGAVGNAGVGSYPIVLTIVTTRGATRTVQVLRTGAVRVP
jgi:prepilin-type N-terminal cleavage/methylation domain-containing protein